MATAQQKRAQLKRAFNILQTERLEFESEMKKRKGELEAEYNSKKNQLLTDKKDFEESVSRATQKLQVNSPWKLVVVLPFMLTDTLIHNL